MPRNQVCLPQDRHFFPTRWERQMFFYDQFSSDQEHTFARRCAEQSVAAKGDLTGL